MLSSISTVVDCMFTSVAVPNISKLPDIVTLSLTVNVPSISVLPVTPSVPPIVELPVMVAVAPPKSPVASISPLTSSVDPSNVNFVLSSIAPPVPANTTLPEVRSLTVADAIVASFSTSIVDLNFAEPVTSNVEFIPTAPLSSVVPTEVSELAADISLPIVELPTLITLVVELYVKSASSCNESPSTAKGILLAVNGVPLLSSNVSPCTLESNVSCTNLLFPSKPIKIAVSPSGIFDNSMSPEFTVIVSELASPKVTLPFKSVVPDTVKSPGRAKLFTDNPPSRFKS